MKYFLLIFVVILTSCTNNSSVDSEDSLVAYLGYVRNRNIKYERRIFFAEKVIENITSKQNDSINREVLFSVAGSFFSMNEWKRLKKTIQLLEKRSSSSKYHLAETYFLYGKLYENVSVNDSAYYYLLKSLKIYTSLGVKEKICNIYRAQSRLQYYNGDYLGSDQSLIKGLRIAKREKYSYQLFDIYCGLGINSNELGDYDESTKYYTKALNVLSELAEPLKSRLKLECLNYLGNNFISRKNYGEAKAIYNYSRSIFNKQEHSFVIYSTILDKLGYTELYEKKYFNAKKLFLNASVIRDSLHIDQGRNFNRLYLSQYYAAVNDTVQSIRYAQEALDLSENFKAPNDVLVCLKQLSLVDKSNALKHSQAYIQLSDSMQKLERITRNKFAKIAFETEEITQEKDRAETQRSLFLTLVIFITALALLLFIIFIQRARQKELVFVQNQQQAKQEIYELIQDRQAKMDQGRQIEKKRIARDLHDGIMNKLASTRFNLYILKNKNDPATIDKCLSYIDNIQDIEKEIRNISHDLCKDQFLEKDSFKRILTTFFDEQQALISAKLHIEIEKDIDWDEIESDKKINLYRILQESLLNIQKHAQANHVFIHIEKKEVTLNLEIHDDGRGYSESNKNIGIGLQNIKTRVKDCSGFFQLNSLPGKGTSMVIKFPITKNTI